MKAPLIALPLLLFLFALVPAQAQPGSATQPSAAAYVSDTVEIPLRAGASNRHRVIGAARSGSLVEVLKVDAAKGYTQIRTPAGTRGWLSSDQLSPTPSSQEQLAETRQELERLKARHLELQQHIDSVVSKPDADAKSYPQLYEEAVRLRQQLAHYRKVAADTVAIDERNKTLQEQAVTLEQELQIIQQENRALRNDNDSIRFLMGVMILGACLLVAVMMPRIREQKRAQWSRL
ncbi:MAG: TIGR04211 family SH3 domain-containing protein [Candidatus Contendobacter sp.]|nr:MAG: TIGR04211 family SH3 domain-containing protein [Candidatus Contendobacter sp.]